MSNEIIKPNPNQVPSFEEFKEIILKQGADDDFLNRAANLHGKIPRLFRVLHNFDPTGTSSAIDQALNEVKSEREQDNILRAIYDLAIYISKTDGSERHVLSEDKFRFLYFVYANSNTDITVRVNTDEVQTFLELPQSRVLSIGEYLDRNEYIEFDNWYQGIKIAHKGIIKIESELLGNDKIPEYVSTDIIKKIKDRVHQRFELLNILYIEAKEDTFEKVSHADLSRKARLDHFLVINQLLPYMGAEGWIRFRTVDTVCITEEGIDKVKTLLK